MRRARAVALVFLLVPSALAQDLDPPRRISFVSAAPPGLGRLLPANLTDDGVPDAVALSGGAAVVLYGGVQYRRRLVVDLDAADVAILPDANDDHTDAIVVAGETGARLLSWDVALQGFGSAQELLTGPAIAVATGPDASGASDWVAALSTGGSEVDALRFTGGPPGSPAPTLVLPEPATALALVQLDGMGAPELAVADRSGARVFDLASGVQLFSLARSGGPADSSRDLLLPLGPSPQALVWISRSAAGTAELRVARANAAEAPVLLDPWVPVAAATGDHDGDGAPDLALALDQSFAALLLDNLAAQGGATFSADSSHAHAVVAGMGPKGNTAGLLLSDLDNDGDADLLLGNSLWDQLIYWSGAAIHYEDDPFLVDPSFELATFYQGFFAAFQVTAPKAVPAGATTLEMRLWTRSAPGAPLALAVGMPASSGDLSSFTANLYLPAGTGAEYGFLDVRPVRRVPGEPPVAYPGLLGVLTPMTSIYAPVVGGGVGSIVNAPYVLEAAGPNPSGVDDPLVPDPAMYGMEKPMQGGIIIQIRDIPLD